MDISKLINKQLKQNTMTQEMKFTGENHHQGDTQWFQLAGLPEGLVKVEKQFVATSERSGSFHALFGKYDMYQVAEEDGGGFIVDVKDDCILNHSLKQFIEGISMDDVTILPKKDHRHTELKKGVYYVGTQQKFDPLAGKKVRVRD